MRLFIILITSIMLLTACGNTDDAQLVAEDIISTNEQEVSTSKEIANEGTQAEDLILKEIEYG